MKIIRKTSTMLVGLAFAGRSRSFAFVVGSSPRFASGRHLAASPSFLDDLQANVQNAFSGIMQPKSFSSKSSPYYTVAITGSSGLVANAVMDELSKKAKFNGKPLKIVKLVRSSSTESELDLSGEESTVTCPWVPDGSEPALSQDAIDKIDAVLHLAGENVATGLGPLGFLGIRPWTEAKKGEIMKSRVIPTKVLSKAISSSKTPTIFLCASGIGVYGDDFMENGKDPSDESADVSSTNGFLAEVSRQWEAATSKASTSSTRVVNLRFGVILSTVGGALAKLYPIFFVGGGGNVGSGSQYFSFISARDAARAIVHTLDTKSLSGPVNVCAPVPCTNAEFTSAMGKVMGRPTILPFPSFAVDLLFGEMGNEMLLGGVRAVPTKLLKTGFKFQHETVVEAVKSAIVEEKNI